MDRCPQPGRASDHPPAPSPLPNGSRQPSAFDLAASPVLLSDANPITPNSSPSGCDLAHEKPVLPTPRSRRTRASQVTGSRFHSSSQTPEVKLHNSGPGYEAAVKHVGAQADWTKAQSFYRDPTQHAHNHVAPLGAAFVPTGECSALVSELTSATREPQERSLPESPTRGNLVAPAGGALNFLETAVTEHEGSHSREDVAESQTAKLPEVDLFYADARSAVESNPGPAWRCPPNDTSIPETPEQKQAWVKKLVAAFLNVEGIKDKAGGSVLEKRWTRTTTAEGRRLLPGEFYGLQKIEVVCWDIVETAIKIHKQGVSWLKNFDPEVLNKAEKESKLTFEKRLNALVDTFRYYKSRCDKMMKYESNIITILTPGAKEKSAKSNREANDRRIVHLRNGKAMAAMAKEQDKNERTSQNSNEEIAGEGHSNMTKNERDPSQRKTTRKKKTSKKNDSKSKMIVEEAAATSSRLTSSYQTRSVDECKSIVDYRVAESTPPFGPLWPQSDIAYPARSSSTPQPASTESVWDLQPIFDAGSQWDEFNVPLSPIFQRSQHAYGSWGDHLYFNGMNAESFAANQREAFTLYQDAPEVSQQTVLDFVDPNIDPNLEHYVHNQADQSVDDISVPVDDQAVQIDSPTYIAPSRSLEQDKKRNHEDEIPVIRPMKRPRTHK
ncbi:hypothetical protein N0V90_005078 [Kalmusia sp. IMI 367209]|nr:hypothetical protein N0V90_005078 [Kalmusia sp. IMI 367209]